MKIIDLLNKIANGEEVPKKIIWNKLVYNYKDGLYYDYCGETLIGSLNFDGTNLHDEIEIIEEEKKIPEKIKSNGKEFYCDNIDSWIDKEKTSAYCEYLMNKYNDLIDYLKSKGDE